MFKNIVTGAIVNDSPCHTPIPKINYFQKSQRFFDTCISVKVNQ